MSIADFANASKVASERLRGAWGTLPVIADDELLTDLQWSPDPDVSCALPDLRYVFYLALGAAVVVAALVMWIVKR